MLRIQVPSQEFFDENLGEFFEIKGQTLIMEHSLISVSKWEAKWHKSYFAKEDKTPEEVLDYFKCMTISPQNPNPSIYRALSSDNVKAIADYISDPMTATVITDNRTNKKSSSAFLTSEVIYYDMFALDIPIECEKWHLNRLLTLIRVSMIKREQEANPKNNRMSRAAIAKQNRAINAARRNRYKTKG